MNCFCTFECQTYSPSSHPVSSHLESVWCLFPRVKWFWVLFGPSKTRPLPATSAPSHPSGTSIFWWCGLGSQFRNPSSRTLGPAFSLFCLSAFNIWGPKSLQQWILFLPLTFYHFPPNRTKIILTPPTVIIFLFPLSDSVLGETSKLVTGVGNSGKRVGSRQKLQLLGWTVAFYELPLTNLCRQGSPWAVDRQPHQPWVPPTPVLAKVCGGDWLTFGTCSFHFFNSGFQLLPPTFSSPFFPPFFLFSLSQPLTTFPGSPLHPSLRILFLEK